jgi:hypothetical protein
MQKSLKKIRTSAMIFLLTCFLILALSGLVSSQTVPIQDNSLSQIQIKGISKMIQGKLLTVPDFDSLSFDTLSKYRKGFESQMRQFPQLNKAQFLQLDNKFTQSLLPSFLAIADNYWSSAEFTDSSVPTSQYVSGTVTCSGQNKPVAPSVGLSASYLELSDYAGRNGSNYGKRWVSAEQMVEGGCGVLKAVNGGREPAGRLVWGSDTFKIVLDRADERTQEATFSAYMRICANLPTGRTCTPYFIKLPWFSVNGHNWVVIGSGVL